LPEDNKESDRELELRTENEIELAKMIVDALWHSGSLWIRNLLVDYEYRDKGFHGRGILRELFFRTPPDENRPSMQFIKGQFETFPLEKLHDIQFNIYTHKKKNKRTVTAADLFNPHRRRTHKYGVNVEVNEVWLTRDDCKVFERTTAGEAAFLEYVRSKGVDPKDVLGRDNFL
jgi:hypothetical protein